MVPGEQRVPVIAVEPALLVTAVVPPVENLAPPDAVTPPVKFVLVPPVVFAPPTATPDPPSATLVLNAEWPAVVIVPPPLAAPPAAALDNGEVPPVADPPLRDSLKLVEPFVLLHAIARSTHEAAFLPVRTNRDHPRN